MKIYDKLISNYGLSKFVESHFRENRSLKSLNNCRNCIILFDRWIEASRNFSFQICLSRMFFQQSFFKQQNIFCNTICVQLYTMTLYSCKIYQVHRTHTFTAVETKPEFRLKEEFAKTWIKVKGTVAEKIPLWITVKKKKNILILCYVTKYIICYVTRNILCYVTDNIFSVM